MPMSFVLSAEARVPVPTATCRQQLGLVHASTPKAASLKSQPAQARQAGDHPGAAIQEGIVTLPHDDAAEGSSQEGSVAPTMSEAATEPVRQPGGSQSWPQRPASYQASLPDSQAGGPAEITSVKRTSQVWPLQGSDMQGFATACSASTCCTAVRAVHTVPC